MSYSSLKKKLQPAKKALKSLSKKLESKLHSFSFSKAINVIGTTSDRLRSYFSDHHFFQKRPAYLRRRHRRNHNQFYQYYYNKKNKDRYQSNLKLNFSPIYLDQFYSVRTTRSSTTAVQTKHFQSHWEPSSSSNNNNKRIRRAKTTTGEKDLDGDKGKEKILYSIEDAWREVVAKSPQLRPVDERAEEFISNFRQDMRLQKEKSILDFQEMLGRGT